MIAAEIPRFGDQSDVAQCGIRPNRGDDRWVAEIDRSVGVPGEDRRQVEAESVDVHLPHPVPQTVEDERANEPVVGSDHVAGPRVVSVVPAIVFEQVVRRVVDPAVGVGRPGLVTLRRVVEHDIQDHLDVGLVQCVDHVAELVELLPRFGGQGVLTVQGEEPECHVSPGRALLRIGLEHGHELHRRHTEFLQVRDLVDQSGVRPEPFGGQARRRISGESPHVRLVDDQIVTVHARAPLAGPRVLRLTAAEHSQWCAAGVRSGPPRRIAVELRGEVDRPGIRIEQHFVAIEAQTVRWI